MVSPLLGIPFARCAFSPSFVRLPLTLPLSFLGSFLGVHLSNFGFFFWLCLLVPLALWLLRDCYMLLAITSSLSVGFHLACTYLLFLGCPGIHARVSRRLSTLVILSRGGSPLPSGLLASRILVSLLVSPSTPLRCSIDFACFPCDFALALLFLWFRLFFWAYQLVLLFLSLRGFCSGCV